jgi:hypothetical protein
MSAALLLPLTTRDPWLAATSRSHRAVDEIGGLALSWARRVGLVTDDDGVERMRQAHFEQLAARIFPAQSPGRVALFAEWLTWLFCFDDERDEGGLGRHADELDRLWGELLAAMAGHAEHADDEVVQAIEVALVDLWPMTAGGMGPSWRRRFLDHLELHRVGLQREASNREMGRVPALDEYPLLRRQTAGTFMWDLVESVLEVEVPPRLASTVEWTNLTAAVSDVIAWCNDIASLPRETAQGDVHNYVLVAASSLSIDTRVATDWVLARISERLGNMRSAVAALPRLFAHNQVPRPTAAAVSHVACVFTSAPRAYIEWLLGSSRYSATSAGSAPAADDAA